MISEERMRYFLSPDCEDTPESKEATWAFSELLTLRASHRKLMDASKRGSDLLQAVCDFIEQNPVSDYTVRYDEAICDAYCLKDDCQISYRDIEDALAEARKVQP